MTTTLKQQIEQWIHREAMKHDDNTTFTNGGSYITGANSMLPLLMCAVDALHRAHYNNYRGIDQSVEIKIAAGEALNKIKQMIEVK